MNRNDFTNRKASRKGTQEGGKSSKTGRVYRYSVNFDAREHVRYLELYERSGLHSHARFIAARVFNETFHVVKTDRNMLDYLSKLGNFYMQFRRLGVNYNQVVKELHTHFSEKKALALLYKMEQLMKELVVSAERIRMLTEELEEKNNPISSS